MTSERKHDPDGLNAFFDAARAAPGPSDDLIARVLADAAEVQAEAGARPARPARTGFWDALGGWMTVSGLAAACAAGVVMGVVLPGALGFDGTINALLEGQQTLGFAGIDAVSFGLELELD